MKLLLQTCLDAWGVALLRRCPRVRFEVDAQRIVAFPKQTAYDGQTHCMPLRRQAHLQVPQAAIKPLAIAHRIACRLGLDFPR